MINLKFATKMMIFDGSYNCIRDLEGWVDLGGVAVLGGCGSFVSYILKFSWNRELKVTYLRAPVELDNKFGYFPREKDPSFHLQPRSVSGA